MDPGLSSREPEQAADLELGAWMGIACVGEQAASMRGLVRAYTPECASQI